MRVRKVTMTRGKADEAEGAEHGTGNRITHGHLRPCRSWTEQASNAARNIRKAFFRQPAGSNGG